MFIASPRKRLTALKIGVAGIRKTVNLSVQVSITVFYHSPWTGVSAGGRRNYTWTTSVGMGKGGVCGKLLCFSVLNILIVTVRFIISFVVMLHLAGFDGWMLFSWLRVSSPASRDSRTKLSGEIFSYNELSLLLRKKKFLNQRHKEKSDGMIN